MSRLSEALAWQAGERRHGVSPSGIQSLRSRVRWEFTPEAITVPFQRTQNRTLRLIGALARKFAMESMPHASGISSPGSPPHAHLGLLRDGIFYRLDGDKSVTVGVVQYSTGVGYSIPDILEFGGTVTRLIHSYRRRRRVTVERRDIQHFRPRPYMRPALERAQKPWVEMWEDSIP